MLFFYFFFYFLRYYLKFFFIHRSRPFRIELIRAVEGHEMHMRVCNTESFYRDADPLRIRGAPERCGKHFGDHENFRIAVIRKVEHGVDVFFWDY